MTLKSVPPEGTAQDLGLRPAVDAELTQEEEDTLIAARAAHDMLFGNAGQGSLPGQMAPYANTVSGTAVQPAQPSGFQAATILPPINQNRPQIDNTEAPTPVHPPEGDKKEVGPVFPPFYSSIELRIADGRILVIGPPTTPHVLTVPLMFADRPKTEFVSEQQILICKIMQYVRFLNGRYMPPQGIFRYEECIALMHELGEIGVKAVFDAYYTYYPDTGPALWNELKKNL